ncbi:MAG TPA: PD-(D/E)XK nuclease family protein, partial [Globicatella sulfidifaciens]|nr:PD-(D/E)XK nuclease family protein [Globicatella sulfidifaciens]
LQREQAFSYLLPAKWLFKAQLTEDTMPQLADDQLLVHGIIDTFYETDDGLVILDYKTDRYRQYGNIPRSEQIELIADKYKFQLSLYAQALSQAKAKPVKDVCVVLLDFNVVYRYDELYTF